MSSHLALAWIPALDTFEERDLEQLKAAVMRVSLTALFDQDLDCLGFETWEQARDAVLQDIDQMAELYASQACSVISFGHSPPKLIAGGMSYGDDPTEQYSQIVRLGNCQPVHNLLTIWSHRQWADKQNANLKETYIRHRAQRLYADDSDDNIEIYRDARVTSGEDASDGYWVEAWVWVANRDDEPFPEEGASDV